MIYFDGNLFSLVEQSGLLAGHGVHAMHTPPQLTLLGPAPCQAPYQAVLNQSALDLFVCTGVEVRSADWLDRR